MLRLSQRHGRFGDIHLRCKVKGSGGGGDLCEMIIVGYCMQTQHGTDSGTGVGTHCVGVGGGYGGGGVGDGWCGICRCGQGGRGLMVVVATGWNFPTLTGDGVTPHPTARKSLTSAEPS